MASSRFIRHGRTVGFHLAVGACVMLTAASARADVFTTVNLLSDGSVPAANVNPAIKNPWGVSFSPTGPFWLSDNGNGLSTLNNSNGVFNNGLIVRIPSITSDPAAAGPTGQVFNGVVGAFTLANSLKANFIFGTEQGTIAAWNTGTTAQLVVNNSAAGAVYKGLAEAPSAKGPTLYAANFKSGRIDTFDKSFAPVTLAGSFADPNAPAGYAPFNIQLLNGALYVTYAKQDATGQNEVHGAGLGFVNKFDLNGNLLARVGTAGTLDAPWGIVYAPFSYGQYAGDLLVGNFGDGAVNAYDPNTFQFVGQLSTSAGTPLSIDGLWALTIGNGANAGSTNTIYFTAGVNKETGGLFGSIADVPEPASAVLLLGGLTAMAALRRRRL